jgi:hypothetical protein
MRRTTIVVAVIGVVLLLITLMFVVPVGTISEPTREPYSPLRGHVGDVPQSYCPQLTK